MKKLMMMVWCFMVSGLVYGYPVLAQEGLPDCTTFEVEKCPTTMCALVIDCRGNKICVDKPFDPPSCGPVAYEGQDVACCEGLVRRCGVAFLDDTCDMFGDNSQYNLPICIPCGDGYCNNFENVCNCPEDCWSEEGRKYEGQLYDDGKDSDALSGGDKSDQ